LRKSLTRFGITDLTHPAVSDLSAIKDDQGETTELSYAARILRPSERQRILLDDLPLVIDIAYSCADYIHELTPPLHFARTRGTMPRA
jgi:hypothetical protein